MWASLKRVLVAVAGLATVCGCDGAGMSTPAVAQTEGSAESGGWAQFEFNADAPFASQLFTFYVQDAHAPPTACRTVFIGSSSIRFWLSLEEDFPELNPLNRGFGGSQINHAIGYFDRLLTPHAPKEIVFYSGENDLNAGLTPEQVLARFETLMALKTDRLGDAPVYFLSIKPSFARLSQLDTQAQANALLSSFADTREDLIYVDVSSPMLDESGSPKSIFISDQLHMDPSGYAIWTEVLSPILSNPERPVRSGCEASAEAQ